MKRKGLFLVTAVVMALGMAATVFAAGEKDT
jgi:hypothetical protein